MRIINPADEKLIAEVATDSAAAVAEKYARALSRAGASLAPLSGNRLAQGRASRTAPLAFVDHRGHILRGAYLPPAHLHAGML